MQLDCMTLPLDRSVRIVSHASFTLFPMHALTEGSIFCFINIKQVIRMGDCGTGMEFNWRRVKLGWSLEATETELDWDEVQRGDVGLGRRR